MGKSDKLQQKSRSKGGGKRKHGKCVLMFDDKDRQDFLTGFHKRKLERRRAALEEMKSKLKEEQKRLREERHKEYLKMLQERRQALDEADELEEAITATTECVQYDHPNHTVTVTTISDLDLSADRLLEPAQRDEGDGEERERTEALPKQAGNPLLSKKIQSLTASLNSLVKQKKRRKQKRRQEAKQRCHQSDRKSSSSVNNNKQNQGKSTKRQRRRQTGRNERSQD